MIRRRLVIGVTCTVAAAILVGSWLMVTSLESRLVANVDDGFTNGSVNIGLRDQLLDRGAADDRLDERRTAVVRYADDGSVVASIPSGPVADPDPLPDGPSATATREIFTIASSGDGPRYRAVSIANRDGGQTLVGVSLAEVDETVAEARRIQLLVGVAAIGVVGVLCLFQIRRAFSPIDGMIASAGRIADGDLTERTPVDEPDSEVGQLATALNRMLDRIESAVDEKTRSEERMRRFVADASHDLRTPLTSVRGYADLYRQGATDPASVARGMDRIEAEATRMTRLVDDLMVLARLDQRPDRDETPVDIGRVVGEAVDAARVVDADRVYDLDLPAEPTVVPGDADQLRQVLDNLLANGRRHTPPGTTIGTTVHATVDEVVIDVVDDGPGFRPDDRARAFDRFWRVTRSDENHLDGSGLGLSIVQSIVENHGGSVTLGDAPGGGAHFVLRFPRDREPSPTTPPGAPT